MYLPLDPKLKRMHDESDKKLNDLERRYPKATTDDFQKSCMIWEFLYGGKSLWVVDCPNRDVQKTMDSFNKIYGVFSGLEAGLGTSAVSDRPNGPATGFQILCYETAKEDIKYQLIRMGILDSEIHWVSESELREQFEDWKTQQSIKVKAQSRSERRKQKAKISPKPLDASSKMALFNLIVEESKTNKEFIALRDIASYHGACQLMNDVFLRMGDPNGNFIRDFQSYGFHARIFELSCFAYLESNGFKIDRSYPSPDFLISFGNEKVAVEAATSNPSIGLNPDISLAGIDHNSSLEKLIDKSINEFPIRMGSILLKKLQKRYWEYPHCQNIPIVLIVSPLYEPGSIFHIDDSLARYLYGGWDVVPDWFKYNGIYTRYVPIKSHTFEGRELETNFFSQPSSEHISAIIYSNSFTENKFVRMAIQMGLESKIEAIKHGTCLFKDIDGNISIRDFEYQLKNEGSPVETWFQGLTIFHNPNALFPVPDDLFKVTNVYKMVNGNLIRVPSEFHPLLSWTEIHPV